MIKGLVSTIWLFGIPKTPFDLVGIYPATVFATANHFSVRSQWSLYLIGLAWLWDMAVGFWLMNGVIFRSTQWLLRTLVQLKDCSYHAIELSEVLAPEQRPILERGSLFEFLGRKGLPWQHLRDVRIFRVDIGQSGIFPAGLACFHIPFLGAVLLVRDVPSQGDTAERFSFWHEVGHTLGDQFARQSMTQKGLKSLWISFLLSLLLVRWSLRSALLAVMIAVACIALYRAFSRLRGSLKLDAEVGADGFAIQFMSPADIEVLRINAAQILPSDRELSHSDRLLRLSKFHEALASYPNRLPWHDPTGLNDFLFDSQVGALNAMGWMVLLTTQFRPVEHQDLIWFSWGVLALTLAAVGRYGVSFGLGIFADLILSGSRLWKDGRFESRRTRS